MILVSPPMRYILTIEYEYTRKYSSLTANSKSPVD